MRADLLDWRSGLGRWGAYDYTLVGASEALPRPDCQRYVWRWLCQRCERFFLTSCETPAQPCPTCGYLLARVGGVWDLMTERAPRWWYGPGAQP
jgi:hypothetical protein